jgi:hypothetical protein
MKDYGVVVAAGSCGATLSLHWAAVDPIDHSRHAEGDQQQHEDADDIFGHAFGPPRAN